MKVPSIKKPCDNCPFTSVDSTRGWLGEARIKQCIEADTFVCHKTTFKGDPPRQCAGHMMLRKEKNAFYRFAKDTHVDLKLSGESRVFKSEEECIKHHI